MEENKDELVSVEKETDTMDDTAAVSQEKNDIADQSEFESESDFADELLEMEHEEADNAIIEGLGDSINRQVELEMTPLVPDGPSDAPEGPEGGEPASEEKKEKKGVLGFLAKIPKWIYIMAGIALFIILLVVFLNISGLGVKLISWFIDSNVNHEAIDANVAPEPTLPEEDLDKFKDMLTPIPTQIVTPTPEPTQAPLMFDKKIMNILLLGVENIDPVTGQSLTGKTSSRGRTDLIVLLTINSEDKTVKLTSFMRDSYVSIPGKENNRINAAYAKGGVALLYDTLEANFGIVPDHYILVNFEDFRTVVDSIGGIDIKLSKKEADYLNKTNYISQEANRNVVEGLNHMNGDQALGYSRIRYVATKGKEKNDFGRTTRHREVIQAIIAQLKKLNYIDLLKVGLECLPLVTTDADAEAIEKYTNMVMAIGVTDIDIQEFRVPQDGTYQYLTVDKMSVIQIDIEKNRDALWRFLYGDSEEEARKKLQ